MSFPGIQECGQVCLSAEHGLTHSSLKQQRFYFLCKNTQKIKKQKLQQTTKRNLKPSKKKETEGKRKKQVQNIPIKAPRVARLSFNILSLWM